MCMFFYRRKKDAALWFRCWLVSRLLAWHEEEKKKKVTPNATTTFPCMHTKKNRPNCKTEVGGKNTMKKKQILLYFGLDWMMGWKRRALLFSSLLKKKNEPPNNSDKFACFKVLCYYIFLKDDVCMLCCKCQYG